MCFLSPFEFCLLKTIWDQSPLVTWFALLFSLCFCMWILVLFCQCCDVNLIQWKEDLLSALLCFPTEKGTILPTAEDITQHIKILTLQLEKGVDSSTDNSCRLLNHCLAKFWLLPLSLSKTAPGCISGLIWFQDSSQKPSWQSLSQAWFPHSPAIPAHLSLHSQRHPHALGHLTGHKTRVLSVMV